jgi:D-alanyl-D-alanine dipeptidase
MAKQKVRFLFMVCLLACDSEERNSEKPTYETELSDIQEKDAVPGFFEQSLLDQGLVDIQLVDSSLLVDLKYSTEDNFFGIDVYGELTKAYLPEDVALKLKAAHTYLKEENPGYRLLVFDAVRPHAVQKILWRTLDSIPPMNRKAYVADPAEGSLHNYGCAVDLSVYDVERDTLLDMGTKYDYFGDLAYPRKEDFFLSNGLLTLEQVKNRKTLRTVMERAGFMPITSEWWHFNSTTLNQAKDNYKRIE